jgi:hypothetical protein
VDFLSGKAKKLDCFILLRARERIGEKDLTRRLEKDRVGIVDFIVSGGLQQTIAGKY